MSAYKLLHENILNYLQGDLAEGEFYIFLNKKGREVFSTSDVRKGLPVYAAHYAELEVLPEMLDIVRVEIWGAGIDERDIPKHLQVFLINEFYKVFDAERVC